VFSASLVLHLFAKVVFNLTAQIKMPIDKWTIIDFVSSCFNIVCFNVIGSIEPGQIMDKGQKQILDYYVIAVVIVSWTRFFSYFLVVLTISKLMMTLYRMLHDTLSFIFIVSCYLLLSATVFTTLFNNVQTTDEFGEWVQVDEYTTYSNSLRTLFKALLAEYEYIEDTDFKLSFSIMLMIHIFISNIFLLNYLVAIIASVY